VDISIGNKRDYQHPLAELWDVDDNEVPKRLEIEKKLITADEILKELLDRYSKSFGGSFVSLTKQKIIINTIDKSKIRYIKDSPQMRNYERFLLFQAANKSLQELKFSFDQIKKLAVEYRTNNSELHMLFYTDIIINNNVVVLRNYNLSKEFINSIKEYGPRLFYPKKLHESRSLVISKRQNKGTIQNGDSGGPVFYFSQELNSVNLVGIHAGSDKSGSTKAAYTLPIEFILKNSPFEIHLVNITEQ
ncbi:30507_t:CDS:2, partial [Racocetra persica]